MLVETIRNRTNRSKTESTVLGLFHISNTSRHENDANICLDGKSEPPRVSGWARNVSSAVIPGATQDIWQTTEDGFYDVQHKGIQPDNN